MSDLEQLVHTSLNNAVENNFADAIAEMTDEQLADDLIQLDADLEGHTQVELVPFIQSWRAA
jgi:hypothetical protein